MQPYFPVATQLPASISVPQDAIDQVTVGTVNAMVEEVADGVKWLTDREVSAQWAVYSMQLTAIASGSRITLVLVAGGTGYSLTDTDRRIVCPANGTYVVSASAEAVLSNASNPSLGRVVLQADTGAGAAPIGIGGSVRWNATTSDTIVVSGSWLAAPVAGAREVALLANCPGGTMTFSNNLSYPPRLSIQRIS